MNMDWAIIGTFVAVLTAGILIGRWAMRVDGRLKEVDGRLKDLELAVGTLVLIHNKELVDLYSKLSGFSPNPDGEKGILLNKLREANITYNEAIRLQKILREEEQIARRENKAGQLLAIVALLVLIAAILSSLGQKK